MDENWWWNFQNQIEMDQEEGSSREHTLGRSSNDTNHKHLGDAACEEHTCHKKTDDEEEDHIARCMAEGRAALRRGIRTLQCRATRCEELGDYEAAVAVLDQIAEMEAWDM